MAEIKKISTELQLLDKFLDTSGDAGTSGQVLSSTGTGINWVSGGSLPGGPYLPLTAGASYPLTGALHFGDAFNYIEKNASSDMLMVANRHITFSDVISGVVNERMRIEEGGNVGIGTTSPTYKLHVNSTDASDNVAYIHHNNAAQSSGDVLKVRSDEGDNAGSA